MPNEASPIAKKFTHKPVEVIIGAKNAGTKNVSHEYYVVNGRERYQTLKRLSDFNPSIFSNAAHPGILANPANSSSHSSLGSLAVLLIANLLFSDRIY